MTDLAAARRMMVDSQLRTSDVTDKRLLAAMMEEPRELFLPGANAGLAYLDFDAPVTEGADGRAVRRLLKPMVLAKLIQAAEVTASDRVLDVGSATGYSSAILARLGEAVIALEEDPVLARTATENLRSRGCRNVTPAHGPLVEGWAAAAPYDVILMNGATELVPATLLGQLKDGGRLVCVLRRTRASKAMLYRSFDGIVGGRPIFDATAPLLPGFAEPPAFVF
jgi:protein-L-isoaspartate(D-aspartate) O-methyltransferase